MAFRHIQARLQERAEQHLLRKRICIESCDNARIKVDGKWYINFSSNDYLGVSQLPENVEPFRDLAQGSGASPVVTGYSASHKELTDYLCELTGYEDVLLFNSGFAANHAICQTLMSQSDGLILADKLSHASLIDGALDSRATLKRFKHNDTSHLKLLLQQVPPQADKLVVTEGVFSMDGDQAPLTDILSLSKEFGAWTMMDDAHGIGVLGKKGEGSIAGLPAEQRPEVLMATFGKAIGSGGAFVAASREVIDYLTNFARHYVYSTAFSPLQAAITLQNLKTVAQQQWRREQLLENINRFRDGCKKFDIPVMASKTAIQPVLVGNPGLTMDISTALKQSGFWVTGIRTPTVPKNTDRLRITLTSLHEQQQIDGLLAALNEAFVSHKASQPLPQEAVG